MKSVISIFLITLCLSGFSQNSVLADGNWYKISTDREGIYQIDGEFLQNNLNIDLSTFDPTTFRVFGNGGKMLPQLNSTSRPQDLLEISIRGIGTEDGTMDPGDRFLFYAPGTANLQLSDEGVWDYNEHFYSDRNYFFVTFGSTKGKRLIRAELVIENYPETTNYDDFKIIDEREIKLPSVNSGRDWYSFISGRTKSYPFDLNGAIGTVHISLSGGIDSDQNSYFEINLTDQAPERINFDRISQGTYDPIMEERVETVSFANISGNSTLTLNVRSEANAEELSGYVNYLVASFSRKLESQNSSFLFSNSALRSSEGLTFQIENSDNLFEIWDVTSIASPEKVTFNTEGSSSSFSIKSDSLRIQRFAAIALDGNLSPRFESEIENQNIRATSPADGLIVVYPEFLSHARRLAAFHKQNSQLDIGVFTIDEIYNEFSGGVPDVTAIRDAVRHFYMKQPGSFKYLLLFGDCSYDYKNERQNNTNLVPTYQSRNSVDPVLSYASDDYFGFMEESEGYWEESISGDHTLEIGVGRIPVNTVEDARIVVDKIISYSSGEPLLGNWKNKITYVVDDGDGNLHMEDAEDFSSYFDEFVPKLTIEKLYIDRFEQEGEGRNQKSPEAKENLINTINQGTFLVNFIGHGDERTWTDESILDNIDISELKNGRKLPIFVTATCEFGRFDEPLLARGYSGAEFLLRQEKGGAIALLTTARPVYASSNYFVNAAFHTYLFEKEEDQLPRLGDIVRKTKNASLRGARNRNFTLLGDPFLSPAFPTYEIEFDEINDKPFIDSDTISAMEKVKLSGSIRDLAGNPITNFNGTVNVRVLDRPTEQKTKGQENPPFVFTLQENTIFNGEASVNNGLFEINFIVPKNITYSYDYGKISAYAVDESKGIDAASASRNIRIGGTDGRTSDDISPPDINMYFNDISFKTGDKIGSSAIFIADIKDESGVNSTGIGISQDIILKLSTGKEYILNNFYTASLDTYQEGKIVFPLSNLPTGRHSAELKIFDIHNNSSTSEVSFIVSEKPQIRLFNVRNYPNPITESITRFAFEHDRAGESLDIEVIVYDNSGSVLTRKFYEEENSSRSISDLPLNLISGSYPPGIYFYHLKVKSNLDGAIGESAGKMIKRN